MKCYNCFVERNSEEKCQHCGYMNTPNINIREYPLALKEGTILAEQYIIGHVLGQGGFGITYLALDTILGIRVAIKEFLPERMALRTEGRSALTVYAGDRQKNFEYGLEKFWEEAKSLSNFIGNPNIVAVKSYFKANNTAYFVMEYVEGTSFKTYIGNKGGRVTHEDAIRILIPIMDALTAVHRKGLIHRDVTPDNIYVTNDGEVKLLDFGSARYSLGNETRSLDVVLKAGYAPREQYTRKGKQGPYTDVYSVAACFYASITGFLPPESLERIDDDNLVKINARGIKIPASLEDAIMKGLEVNSQDRFQTMDEFKRAIENVPPPHVPKRKNLVVFRVLIGIVLVITAAAFLIQYIGSGFSGNTSLYDNLAKQNETTQDDTMELLAVSSQAETYVTNREYTIADIEVYNQEKTTDAMYNSLTEEDELDSIAEESTVIRDKKIILKTHSWDSLWESFVEAVEFQYPIVEIVTDEYIPHISSYIDAVTISMAIGEEFDIMLVDYDILKNYSDVLYDLTDFPAIKNAVERNVSRAYCKDSDGRIIAVPVGNYSYGIYKYSDKIDLCVDILHGLCNQDYELFESMLAIQAKNVGLEYDGLQYFRHWNDSKLYRMFDNGELQLICDDYCLDISIENDYIYYRIWFGEKENIGIYKIKIDGTDKMKLCGDSAVGPVVYKGWVYYTNDTDWKRTFWRVSADGKINEELLNANCEWIYIDKENGLVCFYSDMDTISYNPETNQFKKVD